MDAHAISHEFISIDEVRRSIDLKKGKKRHWPQSH